MLPDVVVHAMENYPCSGPRVHYVTNSVRANFIYKDIVRVVPERSQDLLLGIQYFSIFANQCIHGW